MIDSSSDKSELDSPLKSVHITYMVPQCANGRFKERLKAAIAFCYATVGLMFAAIAVVLNHDRVPAQPPLPDLFFIVFPLIPEAFFYTEIIGLALLGIWTILVIVHVHRWILLRRFLVIIGTLYALRGLCLCITTLPTPNTLKVCAPKLDTWNDRVNRIAQMVAAMGMSMNGINFCGDLIFSGHTIVLTMLYLFISEYTPGHMRMFKNALFWASCVGVFLVLIAREHYTVDVIIAYYITSRLFWKYHTIASVNAVRVSSKANALSRSIFHPIVSYFESDVDSVIVNDIEWPFPFYFRVSGISYSALRSIP